MAQMTQDSGPGVDLYHEFHGVEDVMVEHARSTPPADVLDGLRRQIAARAGHDVETRLAEIDHPTLVCAGRYDAMAPMANSQRLADAIPDARLVVFEGGHFFPLQDRTAYPTMIEFLANGHQPDEQENL